MSRIKTGVIAGLAFGIIDIVPMFFMNIPDRHLALAGAFINRFSIGFLIPNTIVPLPGWATGLLIGLLLSLPDAIITGIYGPILGFGIIGGIVIGLLVNRKKYWIKDTHL
jgi:hypothetical protein